MPERPTPRRLADRGDVETPPLMRELPHYGTRYFGRQQERTEFALSLDGSERLLSVVGTGGVGKTRFVVECLRAADEEGRVVFCDLAEARSLDEAISQIAVRLHVRLSGKSSASMLTDLVVVSIRKRARPILVLDNFEQLVGKTGTLFEALLGAAPNARIVVTSRARLGETGERVIELLPLPTRTEESGNDSIEESPALSLFRDRVELSLGAREASLLDTNESIELVRALDGLPLAIELLAPRMRALALREIHARLPEGIALAPVPGTKGRRSSMRAALDGSWSLLTDAEQSALARSSVFRGGFTANAFSAVMSLSLASEGVSPIDLLQRLRDHSLVTLSTDARGGERRLSLLTLIRDFSAEKLALTPEARAEAEGMHAAFYAHLFDEAEEAEQSGDVAELDRLHADRDNLIAVAERANAESASVDLIGLGLSALAVLDVLVFTKGIALTHEAVLESLTERALTLLGAPSHLEARYVARGLFSRARARLVSGRADDAKRDLDRLVDLCDASLDRTYHGRALYLLASHAVRSGHAGHEVELYERALTLLRASGDKNYEGRCLIGLGAHALANGRTEEAIQLSESALRLFVTLGDRSYEALVRSSLANIHSERGEYSESKPHLDRALLVHQSLGHRRFEGFDYYGLGLLEHSLGHYAEALTHYEMAASICNEVGDLHYAAAFQGYAGLCLATLGRADEAVPRFLEAEQALRGSGDTTYSAFFLACSAVLGAFGGRKESPVDAFEVARNELATTPLSSVESAFTVLKGALDWALGREANDPVSRADSLRMASAEAAARAPDEPKDVRFARAWLRAEIERFLAADRSPEALRVHDKGHWFELPDGARVPCGSRQAIGRILLALATHRLGSPGESLSRADLIRAGWPDERILSSVEGNRLHVAIGRLRKLGLGLLLETSDAGYRLSENLNVQIVSK